MYNTKNEKFTIATTSETIAYILEEQELFSATEYKVIRNQFNGCLLKCSKDTYNGKIKLIYQTEGFKPLKTEIGSLNEESFIDVLMSFFDAFNEVKSNGFLNCVNIDCSLDRILLNQKTGSIALIYLPIDVSNKKDDVEVELSIKKAVIKVISLLPFATSTEIKRIESYLSDRTMSIREISELERGQHRKRSESKGNIDPNIVRLVSMDSSVQYSFVIPNNSVVAGRNKARVDFLVDASNAVSGEHCRFIYEKGSRYIIDLNSSNGTFVNGKRLAAGEREKITVGDVIKLANLVFELK